jgi:hypothetical protein
LRSSRVVASGADHLAPAPAPELEEQGALEDVRLLEPLVAVGREPGDVVDLGNLMC